MILITHVAIALASLGQMSLANARPTTRRLNIAYGLVAGTFATGAALAWTLPSHLPSICVSGLAYLAISIVGLSLARYRLAQQPHR